VLPMTIVPRPRERVRVLVGSMELGRPLGSLSLRR